MLVGRSMLGTAIIEIAETSGLLQHWAMTGADDDLSTRRRHPTHRQQCAQNHRGQRYIEHRCKPR